LQSHRTIQQFYNKKEQFNNTLSTCDDITISISDRETGTRSKKKRSKFVLASYDGQDIEVSTVQERASNERIAIAVMIAKPWTNKQNHVWMM
jgi:hypothetical protein